MLIQCLVLCFQLHDLKTQLQKACSECELAQHNEKKAHDQIKVSACSVQNSSISL